MIVEIRFLLMVVYFIIVSIFGYAQQSELVLKTIVLDAGHGGKDPGCIGTILGIKEKEVNLDIVLKLGRLLKKQYPQLNVIYTRKEDKFIELNERANIANKAKADLFISIHANAGPEWMCGTETYVMGVDKTEQKMAVAQRENAAILLEKGYKQKYDNFNPNAPESYILFSLSQNMYLQNSLMLASQIERHFSDQQDRWSRGVKQAGFLVLWRTNLPSVLVEVGFLSNKEDEAYLSSEYGRIQVAYDIFCAIEAYNKELQSIQEE
ncbi:MAG: N-acetylmuramoyl-L-alanine amidase [Cytophagales bacterium]|nr:MAG: N-acetylmuramoyl-L-alanine amidase [Cytophagales bacterium]